MSDECPRITACIMFEKLQLESSKNFLIQQYCKSDFNNCSRKKLFDERRDVPDGLLPTGQFVEE